MNRLCGTNCDCSDNIGHFSYTLTYGLVYDVIRNYMNFSSISSCGLEEKSGYTCWFYSGDIQVSHNNITDCKQSTAILLQLSRASSYAEYSNFANNTAKTLSVIYFIEQQVSGKLYKSNILSNTGKTIIEVNWGGHPLTVEECVLINNTANNLFLANRQTMVVKHCHFDDESQKYSSTSDGSINSENAITNQFDNNLFDFKFCEAIELMNEKQHEVTLNIVCYQWQLENSIIHIMLLRP